MRYVELVCEWIMTVAIVATPILLVYALIKEMTGGYEKKSDGKEKI